MYLFEIDYGLTGKAMNKTSFIASSLAAAMEKVLPFVPSKPTHPVLGTIYFKKVDVNAQLVGFDLQSMAKIQVTPLAGALPFSFCMTNPNTIYNLLSSFDDGSTVVIEFDEEKQTLKLKEQSNNNFYEFPFFYGADYPEELLDITNNALEEDSWFVVDGNKLKEAYTVVSDSYSTDITKGILTGIHLRVKNDVLTVEATNGHKCAWHSCNVTAPHDEENNPITTVDVTLQPSLIACLVKADRAQLYFHDNLVNIHTYSVTKGGDAIPTGISYASIVKDGAYPRLEQIIPNQFSSKVDIDLNDLFRFISRYKIINGSNPPMLKCSFDGGGPSDLICLEGNGEPSQVHEELLIYADMIDFDTVINFNFKYFEGAIKSLGSLGNGSITMNFNKGNQPVTFSMTGVNAGQLIMPVTVRC